MIQALLRDQTIPWLSHAMHPRAALRQLSLRVDPAWIFRAKDWLDWC
jgi:hypothetical protein